MDSKITCPNCGHHFDIEEVLAHDLEHKYKDKLNQELNRYKSEFSLKEIELKKREEEFNKKREEANKLFQEKLEQEKMKIAEAAKIQAHQDNETLITGLKKQLESYQNEKVVLQKTVLENEKLKTELAESRDRIAFELQKEFNQKRIEMIEEAKKQASENFELKLKDQEYQNKKLVEQIEELQKKANQGSMQSQGEVLEIHIEDVLREMFRLDLVTEVPKGFQGADIIHTVMDKLGNACGTIIYEIKRTKHFSNDWLEKLKSDRLKAKADIAVLVTETMPKEMQHLGIRDSIYVCSLTEFRGLAIVLRESIIQVNHAMKSQVNKGDKMEMLYNYLTSPEFKQRMETLKDTFLALKASLEKERMQMNKIWAEREKQLEKVLVNTVGFYGSIQGIAGSAIPDMNLLGNTDDE
ncbi:MAG TPA: DUF2130 domain-containing protein [Cytophagales bacterium]|nr:DUF2130 domain-containing protein [Cytophagales bacterium]